MWVGLCDENKNPVHPGIIGWVDLDLISWRFIPAREQNIILAINKDIICFPVHRETKHPQYFSFFREIDDTVPQGPVIRFTSRTDKTITSKFQIVVLPGWLVIEIDLLNNSNS